MYRFSDVVYNPQSQTAEIGAGLLWDDVYAALEPHNVNVVGGRVTGVGVAGFTLGGGKHKLVYDIMCDKPKPFYKGYSWKTNQYGLTIDTVTAFELVKPSGSVVTVTQSSDPTLFAGLKVCYNKRLSLLSLTNSYVVNQGRFQQLCMSHCLNS